MVDGSEHLGERSNHRGGADVLALGFGTTVAMWAVGYVTRMPGVLSPSWLVALLMLSCLIGGGFLTGALTGRGWRGGLRVGLLAAVLNLLILGSFLFPEEREGFALPLWLPGTVLAMTLITAAAAALASALAPMTSTLGPPNWTFRFALVAVAATALLLLAGGLVTSREAGLAVPDWPSSYGYNMFLYPLARMTGNIYYEHTHRLVGSLVGLTTIALALHLWATDPRRGMRWLGLLAVVAVIAQGVAGGYRVDLADGSAAQVARPENETAASAALRVVHGVGGQLFLALMVAVAVMTSTAWRRAPRGGDTSAPPSLPVVLLVLLVAQLVVGALLRHLDTGLMLHVTLAVLVFVTALATGMQLLGTAGEGALRRMGASLLLVVTLQVLLGVTALIFRAGSRGAAEPTVGDVAATTAHQVTGAGLLAVSTAIVLLGGRLGVAKPRAADSMTGTHDPSMMTLNEAQTP